MQSLLHDYNEKLRILNKEKQAILQNQAMWTGNVEQPARSSNPDELEQRRSQRAALAVQARGGGFRPYQTNQTPQAVVLLFRLQRSLSPLPLVQLQQELGPAEALVEALKEGKTYREAQRVAQKASF